MEISLLLLLSIPYLVIKYYMHDHETPAEKEYKRYQEGIGLFQKQQFEEAFRYFDQQVKQNPKSAVAYAFRGKCNLRDENFYSAIYDLTQALSYNNTLADCYLDKGKAHLALNEYQEAFREFDKAVWFFHNSNADAMRMRGLSRLRMHQYHQSARDLHRAVEMGDEEARYLLTQAPFYGQFYFLQEEKDQLQG
ncbi:tetratricopeptide repeat protein [Telluribacter sp. SYSU D00476]|uniref:tetratricopeptide repeat protein n=1 Tax=Telluribacter sp. SYSU D00476 TaxID=2811430 RepID=UPI001FF1265A|nr:tetratricopeptide repeat protein [Telluribacter sp. SYSU D00476]